jgi:translation initiation factor IF-1
MVKNTTGGNTNKKFARKHATSSSSKAGHKLRISEDEGELYAITTKNLGNNMFHAIATDGITYLVHIRGKFSGRGKRDNIIEGGVWVLIGLRDWANRLPATSGGKLKMVQCDLLEVYTELDKTRLKEAVIDDWDVLLLNDPTKIDKKEDPYQDEIKWQTEKDVEQAVLLAQIKSGCSAKIALASASASTSTSDTAAERTDMEIYVDDI